MRSKEILQLRREGRWSLWRRGVLFARQNTRVKLECQRNGRWYSSWKMTFRDFRYTAATEQELKARAYAVNFERKHYRFAVLFWSLDCIFSATSARIKNLRNQDDICVKARRTRRGFWLKQYRRCWPSVNSHHTKMRSGMMESEKWKKAEMLPNGGEKYVRRSS